MLECLELCAQSVSNRRPIQTSAITGSLQMIIEKIITSIVQSCDNEETPRLAPCSMTRYYISLNTEQPLHS